MSCNCRHGARWQDTPLAIQTFPSRPAAAIIPFLSRLFEGAGSLEGAYMGEYLGDYYGGY